MKDGCRNRVHMEGVNVLLEFVISKIYIEKNEEKNSMNLSCNTKHICTTIYLPASSIKIVSIL
jgi:ribosome biogenesis protein Nip4